MIKKLITEKVNPVIIAKIVQGIMNDPKDKNVFINRNLSVKTIVEVCKNIDKKGEKILDLLSNLETPFVEIDLVKQATSKFKSGITTQQYFNIFRGKADDIYMDFSDTEQASDGGYMEMYPILVGT